MAARRTTVAIAALLALAGCAGTGVSSSPELTVTPAPVPTDARATPAYRLAPGLAPSGVVDPLALATAHAAVLRATAYEVTLTERSVRPDGTLLERRTVEGRFVGPTRYRLTTSRETARGPDPTSTLYADGERLYERLETRNDTRYYLPRARFDGRPRWPEDPEGHQTQRDELYAALAGSTPSYAGPVELDGVTHHRIVAPRATHASFLAAWEYVDTIETFRFVATVRGDGLVRSYRLHYVATSGGERRIVTRSARWSALDDATVDPPAWYATARERTGG